MSIINSIIDSISNAITVTSGALGISYPVLDLKEVYKELSDLSSDSVHTWWTDPDELLVRFTDRKGYDFMVHMYLSGSTFDTLEAEDQRTLAVQLIRREARTICSKMTYSSQESIPSEAIYRW